MLSEGGIFCSHCGAPQLRYAGDAEGSPEGAAQSALPPHGIRWKEAVVAAITVAVPVGLLSSSIVPLLADGCCLWVVGGAVMAVALYRRRTPHTTLDGRMGFRLGAIIGLLAAFLATALNGATMVFERYALHGGAAMEKAFQDSMEQGAVFAGQLYHVSPAQAQQTMQFWLSPDGRAAAVLLTALMAGAGIIFFSAIGGVLGARIFSARDGAMRRS